MSNRSRAAKRLARLYSVVVRRCQWLNHLASRGIARVGKQRQALQRPKSLLSRRVGFFQRIGALENLEERQLLSANLPNQPVAENITAESRLESVAILPTAVTTSHLDTSSLDADASFSVNQSVSTIPVIFVDANVSDYESLIGDILGDNQSAETQIHLLDSTRDGVTQISETLASLSNVGAIHILSHGSAGALQLGSTILDSNGLEESADQLRLWGNALSPHGDIILYGCNVAQGQWGVDFLENLSGLTGADIAASDNLTGNDELGGDWTLEYSTGVIDAAILSVSYSGTLATVTGENTANNFKITANAVGVNGTDTAFDNADTVEISGKQQNDTFKFEDWPQATIKIAGAGGQNTVDFDKLKKLFIVQTLNDGSISRIDVISGGTTESITPVAGNSLDVQIVKGGKQTTTLNMSAYNQSGLTFTIKDGKDSADNEVVVTRADNSAHILTVENVGSINGGTLDDVFVFENGATMTGEIDGGGGNNAVDYSSFKRQVTLDVDANTANTPRTIVNVNRIIGSPGASGILSSKIGNQLTGDDQTQEFIGGPRQDIIQGRGGSDRLTGSGGDDIYRFSYSDFDNANALPTIIEGNEDKAGDADTLDFSDFPKKDGARDIVMTFEVRDTVQTGATVKMKVGNFAERTLFATPVQNIENILIGEGSTLVEFHDNWGVETRIGRPLGDVNTARVDLDMSAVTHDLIFTILENGVVNIDEAEPDGAGGFKLKKDGNSAVVTNVHDLTGGQGNNTYVIKSRGAILGKLNGGNNVGDAKNNILDYSKYGSSIAVNFTSDEVEYDDVVRFDRFSPTALAATKSPRKEKWNFESPATSGTISIPVEGQTPFDFDTDLSKTELYQQQFHALLSSLIGRSDFTVDKSVSNNKTVWTVIFAEPGQILDSDGARLWSSLSLIGTTHGVRQVNAPEGIAPVDQTYDIWTEASSGDFKLTFRFTAPTVGSGSETIIVTTQKIAFDASPDEIKAIIDKAIQDRLVPNPSQIIDLDVPPQIFVSGMGTEAFPWRITFANLGRISALTSVERDLGIAEDIPRNWATGFPDLSVGANSSVTNITSVIGSTDNDRVFGTASTSTTVIANMDVQAAGAFQDSHTLRVQTTGNIANLVDGQPVLYRTVPNGFGQPSPSINGLVHGRAYYVKIDDVGGFHDIKFFDTKSLTSPIEISSPANATNGHQLVEAFQADGHEGTDRLIAYTTDNDANESDRVNAIVGGDGADVIAGGNGSDYIDGGGGNDRIYGDGGHPDPNEVDTDVDVVRAGGGDDRIYGNSGTDYLIGGSGGDLLVGGAGSDVIEGGAGPDKLLVIEAGAATDYDKYRGGSGNDTFLFDGKWGVASIDAISNGGEDTIDLSAMTRDYVHVLSNGGLYSTSGTLYNDRIQPSDDSLAPIKLSTKFSDLTGSTKSPGQVVTEVGFGLHQAATGKSDQSPGSADADAKLTAFGNIPSADVGDSTVHELTEKLELLIWFDAGDGPTIYEVSLDADIYNSTTDLLFELQAAIGDTAETGITVGLDGQQLTLTGKANGTIVNGKAVPAQIEVASKSPNSVVVGNTADRSFENIEVIKTSQGTNSFVFGNDYWQNDIFGSFSDFSSITALKGLNPFNTGGLSNSGLKIDTSEITSDAAGKGKPLTIDLRAVNTELEFYFSKADDYNDENKKVKLTIKTAFDGKLPIIDMGPIVRYNTVEFSHVANDTIIHTGRFKNTIIFEEGVTFNGSLNGSDGHGLSAASMAGRPIDVVSWGLGALETAYFNHADITAGVDELLFEVENTIKYSQSSLVTTVNLEGLKKQNYTADQHKALLAANLLTTNTTALLDTTPLGRVGTSGLSAHSTNLGSENLGEVIVKSGLNYVRGNDWDPFNSYDGSATGTTAAGVGEAVYQATTTLLNGADTISVGDSINSITPGLHVLSGGSGADTYQFRTQWWGGALIVEPPAFTFDASVFEGDPGWQAIFNTLGLATNTMFADTLDFSALYQDLYFTVFEISTRNIGLVTELANQFGSLDSPLNVGMTITLITPEDPYDSSLGAKLLPWVDDEFNTNNPGSGNFGDLFDISLANLNWGLALGIENIVGGRGANTVKLVNGANLQGSVSPGFGGSLAIDYSQYAGSANHTTTPDAGGSTKIVNLTTDEFVDVTNVPSMAMGINTDVEIGQRYQYMGADGSFDLVAEDYTDATRWKYAPGLTKVDLGANLDQQLFGSLAEISIFEDLPDQLKSLIPNVTNQWGTADAIGGAFDSAYGVGVGGNVTGTPLADTIAGNNITGNTITGDAGNDTLSGKTGDDTLLGGDGDDTLYGDTASGSDGSYDEYSDDDTLDGGDGNDSLHGGRGNDTLIPGSGDNVIDGGAGSDTYETSTPNNLVAFVSRAGEDLTQWQTANPSVTLPTGASTDTISNVETIRIKNVTGDLPGTATYIVDDGVSQTIEIDATGMAVGTYELHVDDSDIFDWGDYGSKRVRIGTFDGNQQTLEFYQTEADKDAGGTPSLTLVLHGATTAIWEGDLNVTGQDPLSSGVAGNTATPTQVVTGAEFDAIVAEAKAQWLLAADDTRDALVQTRLDQLDFTIVDLPGTGLAQISNNTIAFDLDAAGHGWYIDGTPTDSTEFTESGPAGSLTSSATDPAFGQYDLLTVVTHEFAHALGLDHVDSPGDLLDDELSTGTRAAINISPADALAIPLDPTSGNMNATLSDQERLEAGFTAFASWATRLADDIESELDFDIPFLDLGLDELWGSTGTVILDGINNEIRDEIATIFDGESAVSSADLLAMDFIEQSPSDRLGEYEVELELTSTSTGLQLSLEPLKDLGLDLTSFVELTQSEPINVEAALDLRFSFGLDPSGIFFIENPTLVGRVTVDHDQPLDVSLDVGPLGVGIEDGTLFFEAGIAVPTEGRAVMLDDGSLDVSGLDVQLPRFDSQSSFEVDLPIGLRGALAGINEDGWQIQGEFNRDGGITRDLSQMSALQFFTAIIPEQIQFDGPSFDSLLDLANISLDDALAGIETALRSAIDTDGAAYQKLPLVNQSAVELLGNGSVDVVEGIANGISVVRENLTDINRAEIDLNQELNDILDLGLAIGG